MSMDRNYLFLLLLGLLLFLTGLGSTHLFDWDEINFAECAREMIVSGNYSQMQIAFKPFWEKPPLFIWLQALSMNVFGINEFAARLPNAIIGLFTLLLLYAIGKYIYNKKVGLLWSILYCGSYLSFFYFKSGIIDPLFNLTIFISIVLIALYYRHNRIKFLVWSGLVTGLAIMTKGPVAWLIVGFSWILFLIFDKRITIKSLGALFIWFLFSLPVTSLWFGYETWHNGSWFVATFIQYQIRLLTTPDAGHGGFLLYHWVVLLCGMLPASVYAIGFLLKEKFNKQDAFTRMMILSFWVVLIVFTLVKTKIVHYSSFAYYPITFIAARYITSIIESPNKVRNRLFNIAAIALSIMALVIIGFIYLVSHPQSILQMIHDDFIIEALQVSVYWPVWLYAIPILFIVLQVVLVIYRNISGRYELQSIFNAGYLLVLLLAVVPRVETFSQQSYIEMCKEYGKDGDTVLPYGFKSYAHLFYGKQRPQNCRYSADEILTGAESTSVVYFICKKNKEQELMAQQGVTFVTNRGGYYLFKRVNTSIP